MQLVLQQRPPEFFLHQALALRGKLPVREAHFLHDVVDVCNDALDDNVRVGVLRFLEEFRQCFFGAVALLFGIGFFSPEGTNRGTKICHKPRETVRSV